MERTRPSTGQTGPFCTLGEPIHDRMLAMVLQVASDLWVTRDRLRLLEETLTDAGVPVARLEAISADPARWERVEPERDDFIARILAPLTEGTPANDATTAGALMVEHRLLRHRREPVHCDELEPVTPADAPTTLRWNLNTDPEAGWSTHVTQMHPGYRSPLSYWNGGRLEYHTCHEEIFLLSGTYRFGRWYDWDAPGYLNHPPYWVHPADHYSPTGARLLIKNSQAVDYGFCDVPEGWDGREFVFPGAPSKVGSEGVTRLALDDLPWQQATGWLRGVEHKRIWHDVDLGWTTWLMRVPPGWRGDGEPRQADGGDEIYVVSGDLTLCFEGEQHRLGEGGYCCSPEVFWSGGADDHSENGCLAVRWLRDGTPAFTP